MAISAGLPVDKVLVEALGLAPDFTCRVTLYLSSAPDQDVADKLPGSFLPICQLAWNIFCLSDLNMGGE